MARWQDVPLMERMWKTKNCRFAAHNRLRRKSTAGSYTIAVLALYTIAASLAPLVGQLTEEYTDFLSVVAVLLSILVIIVSILEAGKNQMAAAEALHVCAREVARLLNELEQIDELDEETRRIYSIKYDEAVDRCQYNHEPVDYMQVQAENPGYFKIAKPSSLKRNARIRWLFNIYFFNAILLAGAPLLW